MIVRGGGLPYNQTTKRKGSIENQRFVDADLKTLDFQSNLGLCDDGLLTILLVTVPIMLWLMVSVVVAARRAASFFLPSAAAFIGS